MPEFMPEFTPISVARSRLLPTILLLATPLASPSNNFVVGTHLYPYIHMVIKVKNNKSQRPYSCARREITIVSQVFLHSIVGTIRFSDFLRLWQCTLFLMNRSHMGLGAKLWYTVYINDVNFRL